MHLPKKNSAFLIALAGLFFLLCQAGCAPTLANKSAGASPDTGASADARVSPDTGASSDARVSPDKFISEDTVWSGRILIDGIVKVAKGATLTISPGTDIAFVRRDADAHGLGDAVLAVEGRLMAVGTREQPICWIVFPAVSGRLCANDGPKRGQRFS